MKLKNKFKTFKKKNNRSQYKTVKELNQTKLKKTSYLKLFFLVLILQAIFISSWAFGKSVLDIKTLHSGNYLTLTYNLVNGYGIQKKADNHLIIYRLKNEHIHKRASLRTQIKKYGIEVARVKKFKGKTSKQDRNYFDILYPSKIKLNQKNKYRLAIMGRVFYCSFSDKFCSVQSIAQLVL